MTCREFAEFLADYVDGELPDDTKNTFESHLAICENCRKYLAIYRSTTTLGQHAFDHERDALPRDVPAALVDAILAARKRPGPR